MDSFPGTTEKRRIQLKLNNVIHVRINTVFNFGEKSLIPRQSLLKIKRPQKVNFENLEQVSKSYNNCKRNTKRTPMM